MVAAVATGRMVMMAEVAGSAWSLRRVVRHPRVLGAGVAGLAAQNVWAATRAIARRTVDDPWIGWSDAAAVSAALVTEVTSWGVRGLPPGSNWSLLFSTVVCAWLPLELPSTPMLTAALAQWLVVYQATTGGGGGELRVAGQRVNEALTQTTFVALGARFARRLRSQAQQLDTTRELTSRQAAVIAAAGERERQRREIHDSVLQVLETVAGGWTVSPELLQRRIEFEIRRLEGVMNPAVDEPVATLESALSDLCEECEFLGLAVTFSHRNLDVIPGGPSVEALRDAAREALMNIYKHADTDSAVVDAEVSEATIRVVVRDDGRGFDSAAPRVGFGLNESVIRRMGEVNGSATINSTPGRGTVVTLVAPWRRSRD